MRKLILPALFAAMFVAGCTKDETLPPPVSTTPTSFFKFKMDDVSFDFNADIPQYMPFYANEAGGYQVADANLIPAIGLRLSWPAGHTVTESELLGLQGKTLYFSDTAVHPQLIYTAAVNTDNWESVDTNSTTYDVKITNVTFVKKDTSVGNALRTYQITGSCHALMQRGGTVNLLSAGAFRFIICRRDL